MGRLLSSNPWGGARIASYDVVRVLLGVVLLTAAALKAHQLATEPVRETGLLDSRWFLTAAVEFELFFGLWLLSGIWSAASWSLAVVCFSLFAVVTLIKGLSGDASCGCFGRVSVNPWYTFVLDASAVLALCRSWPKSQTLRGCAGRIPDSFKLMAAVPIWLAIAIPTGFLVTAHRGTTVSIETGEFVGDDEIVILEPEKWVTKRFPLLQYIDIGEELANGEWIVVFYHHDCPKCQDEVPQYERLALNLASAHSLLRIALIEMWPYADDASAAAPQLACVRGRLRNVKEFLVETPASLILENGVVTETGERRGKEPISYTRGAAQRSGTRLGGDAGKDA